MIMVQGLRRQEGRKSVLMMVSGTLFNSQMCEMRSGNNLLWEVFSTKTMPDENALLFLAYPLLYCRVILSVDYML